MIENPMVNYHQPRMTHLMAQEVAAYYAERKRRPTKQEPTGCITPVPKSEGSRFDWIR